MPKKNIEYEKDGLHFCTGCHQYKPIEDFSPSHLKIHRCKKCFLNYQRNHKIAEREEDEKNKDKHCEKKCLEDWLIRKRLDGMWKVKCIRCGNWIPERDIMSMNPKYTIRFRVCKKCYEDNNRH